MATGVGFDGNGNGSTLDSGPAGNNGTQTSPGTSGDVPAFSSNTAPASGSLGGAGWRTDALRIVILATDICSIAAFPADEPIPTEILGSGGVSEPSSALACSSTPGSSRFGFVSDAKSTADNTVLDAIVPSEAGTVQETIDALNALGIRVIGMGPGAAPSDSTGPSFDESVFLSALARLTNAVDDSGNPLVFSTSVTLPDLSAAIEGAITTTTAQPIDISLMTSGSVPPGLSVGILPPLAIDVAPGDQACFDVTFSGSGSPAGTFDLDFQDVGSGIVLGTLPVTVDCGGGSVALCDIDGDTQIDRDDVGLIFSARGTLVGSGDPRDFDGDGRITINDARNCVLQCTNSRCAP